LKTRKKFAKTLSVAVPPPPSPVWGAPPNRSKSKRADARSLHHKVRTPRWRSIG